MSIGLDSLELVRVRNKLGQTLSIDLPATTLLDYPTIQGLGDHLDKQLGPPPGSGPALVSVQKIFKDTTANFSK